MYSILVLVSGAPRAGKNTLVNGMLELLNSDKDRPIARAYSISKPIKDKAHSLLSKYLPTVFQSSSPDHMKDDPQDCLNGYTFRDLYVHVGQMDQYAPGLWANMCADEILSNLWSTKMYGSFPCHRIGIVESVGKQAQFEAVMRHDLIKDEYLEKVLVIHLERPGYDYTDNRTPIMVPSGVKNLHELRIVNDGVSDVMCQSAVRTIQQLCGE